MRTDSIRTLAAYFTGATIALLALSAVAGCRHEVATSDTSNDATDPNADPKASDSAKLPNTGSSSTPPPSTPAPAKSGVPGGGGTYPEGGAPGGNEFNTPPTCTNGSSYTPLGEDMTPGRTCNTCHSFGAAGTVYPTAHEPDQCKGVDGTKQVGKVIAVDANNKTYEMPLSADGNFHFKTAIPTPFTVKVVAASGAERKMNTPITGVMGNCNVCHTEAGTGSPLAPGRVLFPR